MNTRWLIVGSAIVAALATLSPVSAGPRSDAFADIGVGIVSLPADLQDAKLETGSGCVALTTDSMALGVCRYTDLQLSAKYEYLALEDTWEKVLYARSAVDPSVAIQHAAPSHRPGSGPSAIVDDLFQTTSGGVTGTWRLTIFNSTDYGVDTVMRTFTAAAPNGDAITIVAMESSAHYRTSNQEYSQLLDQMTLG